MPADTRLGARKSPAVPHSTALRCHDARESNRPASVFARRRGGHRDASGRAHRQARNAIDSSVKIPTGSSVDRQRERAVKKADSVRSGTAFIRLHIHEKPVTLAHRPSIRVIDLDSSHSARRHPMPTTSAVQCANHAGFTADRTTRDTRRKHFGRGSRAQFSSLKHARATRDSSLEIRRDATFLRISAGRFVSSRPMPHPRAPSQDACVKPKRMRSAAARCAARMQHACGAPGMPIA